MDEQQFLASFTEISPNLLAPVVYFPLLSLHFVHVHIIYSIYHQVVS